MAKWCSLEHVYPVGCIYTSFDSTNPKDLFNFGKWEEIKDVFLYCSRLDRPSKQLGGSSTHTLTVNELPQHSHVMNKDFVLTFNDRTSKSDFTKYDTADGVSVECLSRDLFDNRIVYKETEKIGNNESFSIMPPYITCYSWTRIE